MKKQKTERRSILLVESFRRLFRSIFFFKKNEEHERWKDYLSSL
jgi:hypothetical protein